MTGQLPKIGAVKSVNCASLGMAEMKHRIVPYTLQKYVLNPPIKLLFAVRISSLVMRYSKPSVGQLESRDRLQWAPRASAIDSGSWQSTA